MLLIVNYCLMGRCFIACFFKQNITIVYLTSKDNAKILIPSA